MFVSFKATISNSKEAIAKLARRAHTDLPYLGEDTAFGLRLLSTTCTIPELSCELSYDTVYIPARSVVGMGSLFGLTITSMLLQTSSHLLVRPHPFLEDHIQIYNFESLLEYKDWSNYVDETKG